MIVFEIIKDYLEEYLQISKPKFHTMRGWKEWRETSKNEYPWRYLVTETIPTQIGSVNSKIHNAVWAVRHRIDPRHRYHILDLRRGDTSNEYKAGWLDSDHQIQYAIVAVLRNYIESELPHSRHEENPCDVAARRLYNFFMIELPAREKHSNEIITTLYPKDYMIGDEVSPEMEIARDSHWKYDEETQEMVKKALHDCIDNMGGWWS